MKAAAVLALALAFVVALAPAAAEGRSRSHSSRSHGSTSSHSSRSHGTGSSHSSSSHYSGSRSHGTRTHSGGHRWRSHGKRDPEQRARFMRSHPCPSTGRRSGSCPGYVVDHITPLKRGGSDDPSNMQWQSTSAAKAKDRRE